MPPLTLNDYPHYPLYPSAINIKPMMMMQTIFVQLNNKLSITTYILPKNVFVSIIKCMPELWFVLQTANIGHLCTACSYTLYIKMHWIMCSVRVFILYAAIYIIIVVIYIVYSSRLLLLFFKFARPHVWWFFIIMSKKCWLHTLF